MVNRKHKNQSWLTLAALILVIAGLAGCSKPGFGGNAGLTGVVNHHELPIPNAMVFLKFDSRELPGTTESDFDASTTSDAEGIYRFEGLHNGDYYLYSVGYDSAISEVVLGGVYVKVTSGAVNQMDIPVTE